MAKADLSRDYYGDLGLQPGAEITDIKRQFKKLALTWHPDRNPGRESEVIAKFQQIQSAHEVLTDATERAKYDNNRVRSSGRFGGGFSGSSGVRGNPWSDLGSQYPPPPKAPTARKAAQPQQPPPSGADRYKKWETPKQTAYQAAHEGAGARQKTYEAWESMKTKPQPSSASQAGSSNTTRPPVPPRETPQPQAYRGGDYSSFDIPQPKKKDDGRKKTGDEPSFFDTQRARQAAAAATARKPVPEPHAESPPKKTQSTRAFDNKRFAPSTPGGDEPAASKGAYFTQRDKPAVAPELPARFPTPNPKRSSREMRLDDLSDEERQKYFGNPQAEPRVSTPYASQGGEKLNPRDSASINRSKSTREASQRTEDGQIPRPGSDSNMHRSHSSAARGQTASHRKVPSIDIDTDSSDDIPQANGRPFGKPRSRATNGASAAYSSSQVPPSPLNSQHQRKRSDLADFQDWWQKNSEGGHPLNSSPLDETPRSEPTTANPESKAEPSMYAHNTFLKSSLKRSSTYTSCSRLPKVSEDINPPKKKSTSHPLVIATSKYPNLFPDDPRPVASSGNTNERGSLTAFEGMQRSMIDQLLYTKQNGSGPSSATAQTSLRHNQKHGARGAQGLSSTNFTKFRESSETKSPPKSRRSSQLHSSHSYDSSEARCFWTKMEKLKADTNDDRFTFNVNDDTFKSPAFHPAAAGFTSSSENISTKFSEKDWTGKFEGTEYFKPVPTAPSRAQSQSSSRSRGRSPTKPTIDPRFPQPSGSEEHPAESPGGTRFSAQEWANTFKPQTFAPPPPRPGTSRKRTGPMARPTGGVSVVDDGSSSDEKTVYNGHKAPVTPTMPSPDAMDVDMPPVNIVPQFAAPPIRVETTTSPKRPAAPSPSPTDDAALKVNFDDLKIQDLLSTLEMPRPPQAPALPENLPNTRPSEVAYEDYQIRFAKYMTAWDLYNNQFLLHLVARKNQNDGLGMKRWLSEEGIEIYRRGLKEDAVVLSRWGAEKEKHDTVVREWVVLKEKIKEGASREPARARKKTH